MDVADYADKLVETVGHVASRRQLNKQDTYFSLMKALQYSSSRVPSFFVFM
jgi:hypothetical protein